MSEETPLVSISSSTSLNPDEIPRRTFASARKGVDAEAVRRYLETVADDVRLLLQRETQLRRLVADAERKAAEAERKAAEPPVLDEVTLNRAVGAETGRVLQSAHDAAREVVARAEERATELIAEAEARSAERDAAAEAESSRLIEAAAAEATTTAAAAQAEAGALREAAETTAQAVVEAAREDAVELLDTTKRRCRQTVRDARQLRNSVLSDLVERRRGLFVQLEQLRSGRDSLVEVVATVEDTVEELKARLAGAEHDARVAAADAGDRAEVLVDAEADKLVEPDVALELHSELLGADLDLDEDVGAESGAEPEVAEDFEAVVDLADETLAEDAEDEQQAEEVQAQDTAASHRSVGELFARIRAARGSDVSADTEAIAIVPEPEAPAESAIDAEVSSESETPQHGDTDREPETAEVERVPAGPGAAAEAEMGEDPPAATDADADARARRDALVAPVLTRLSRALKRALQDDQNELLNALRRASGTPDLSELLPEDLQRERYAGAATAVLTDAWLIGRGWLRPPGAGTGDSLEIGSEAGEIARQLGIELADELSGLLRYRLSESLGLLGEVGEGAQDAAGAAYREWKGPRVEGIAGDFATRAFASGAVSAATGTIVRWVVDDGKPCPDCDDNALAGEQAAGEAWPTGQVHPPVHPGCRCLLVATTD
jgi:cell division septum initiation protein DivIVA